MRHNENTYRIYIPETENIKCCCDVRFDEERNGSDLLRYEEGKNDKNENLITIRLPNYLEIVEKDKDDNEVT